MPPTGRGLRTHMNAKNKNRNIILFLIVVVLAAAYFSPAANRFLNPDDEGYLLYNFDRFARGDLPHRDFYDIYGALTYFLGGALFKLFGTKLLAIRIFVVVLMAAMAGLIFLIGCRVMPRRFALLGSALFVIYWGDPVFPLVLYGNHCAHLLALVGILCVVAYVDGGKKRWILAAGFCAGLGLLFKLPVGVFTLMAFGLFLSFKEQFPSFAEPDEEGPVLRYSHLARISRLSKFALVIAVAAVFTLYFSVFHLDFSHFVIFLLPLYIFLGWMLTREASILRALSPDESRARWTSFKEFLAEVALLAAGPVFLFALQILFYYLVGGLHEMLYDTFVLPSAIDYYWPMDSPGLHAALIVVIGVLVLLTVLIGRHWGGKNRITKAVFFAAVLAASLAPTAYVFMRNMLGMVWRARVSHVLPTSSLLVTFPILLKLKEDNPGDAGLKLVLSLYYIFSCLFFIISFPRTDVSHIVHASTVIFVIAAFLLWKLDEGGKHVFGGGARARRSACGVAVFILIGLAFLWNLRVYFTWEVFDLNNPRAQNLKIHRTESYINLIKTVDFIREHTLPDERIFVISEQQVIYFLSGRDTALMKENYFTYLSNLSFIDADSSVRLTDERIIERLRELKPRFVIEERDDNETRCFLRTWPKTAAYIRAAYSPVAHFKKFQILQLKGSTGIREGRR